jgi:hypothetical protein|tara:strand:+ start:19 stop:1104 length:1086 start_codon:yes stop_codon:yes gene_type:complete
MDIKIVLGIEIRNKKPVIYYKNNVIIFDENNYSEIILEDKQEIGSVFNFAVENIENNSASILIKKILINGIEANIFHNTSFIMKNNRWVENKTLKSVYRIDYNGTFALDITEQYVAPIKSQHWHVSNTINDYIFVYNFTNDVFDLTYKPRNRDNIVSNEICVLGDSFTYGTSLDNEHTWPVILEKKLNETVNNLAVPGAGIDLIYNNFVRLCKEHSFKKIIIVLPHLERRVIKCRVDDGKFYRVPNAFSPANDSNAWRYANYPVVMKKRKHVEEQMVKDIDCVYSKKIIKKMISVAKKQSIHLFLSSRSEDTYNFLQSLTLTNSRLLPFYNINWFKERAPNGYHPSPTHNDHFVNLILDQI